MTDILYTMGTGIGALTVLAALGWLLGAAVPKGWRIDDSHSMRLAQGIMTLLAIAYAAALAYAAGLALLEWAK